MKNREDYIKFYDKIRTIKLKFGNMTNEATQTVNQFRKVTRKGVTGDVKTRSTVVAIMKQNYADKLKSRLFSIGFFGEHRPENLTLAGQTIPHWADVICEILLNKHGMTQDEAIAAFGYLENEGLEFMPSLSIHVTLEAMMCFKNTNETPNDHIDILRISGALPLVDILVVDSVKASEICDLQLDKKYNTKVYSGKDRSVQLLEAELNRIVNLVDK